VRALGLRSALAILIVSTSVGLAVGSASAEMAAPAAQTELEAPDGADSGVRDATPTAQRAERGREQRQPQYQRRKEWWTHARAVLMDGIELGAEQARGVDEIIETQLDERRRSVKLRAELRVAEQRGDAKRIRAIRIESRDLRARRKGPHECIEEMRALLSEEQHPTFDMNRARLAAEGQQPRTRKERRKLSRSAANAEVETESADAAVKTEGADAEVEDGKADVEAKAEGVDAAVEAETTEAEGVDAAAEAE
jgi:hypothetical protein